MSDFISLAKAIELTKRFRQKKEEILKPQHVGQEIFTICDTFSKDIFEKLLAKNGCAGIRIYYGMDDTLKIKPIAVAINANGEDMLPGGSDTDDNEDIGDDTKRCPPDCPPPSPLNQP